MNWRCNECDRCNDLAIPGVNVVVATPSRRGGLLVIGEAPGQDENDTGIGFIGVAGRKIRKLLLSNGVSCVDYGVANICRCGPPRNANGVIRHPTTDEISQCLPYLSSLIVETQPKVILAVGAGTAANVLFGCKKLDDQLEIGRQVGWRAADISARAPVALQEALVAVSYIVPMPHTSPSNRTLGHAAIAEAQVAKAAELLYQPE